MKRPLTGVQRDVLDFIRDRIAADGIAPTQNEIRARFGWSSPGTVWKHLRRLEDGGHIVQTPNQTRGIAVVEDRLFVAPGLPDARELLKRVMRALPEALPASGTRMKSAMRLTGLGSTCACRMLEAHGLNPSDRVGRSRHDA